MTEQDLKNSILQLAIQGKLVEQREEEGNAKELIEQIKNEKQQLIKEKKIKKEKPLPEILEEDIIFDIPDSWEWTRITNVADLYTGNSIPKDIREGKYSKVNDGYDYIATKDVSFNNVIEYESGVKIPFSEERFKYSYANSILMCIEGGSAGRKIGILDKIVCFGNKLCSFNSITIEPLFMYYYLQSPSFIQLFKENMTGIIGGVSITKLKGIVLPLPPLEEQKRIVSKIEELMPYVENYGKAYCKIEQFNKQFPDDMNKSILQYAIQGKLVDQREEDGTAEELYEKIEEEKMRLIKEGTIKKEKPLLEITEEEKPFEIPESWKWVRLGNLMTLLSGQDFPVSKYNDKLIGIPYITGASNFSNNHILINRWTDKPRCIAKKEDILLVCKGSGYGKTLIADFEEAHIARQIMALKCFNLVEIPYILKVLEHNFDLIKSKGQGVIPGIDRESVRNILVTLPPFEEQKRILKKIEDISPYMNKLKNI